ncbi:MAG TPA: ABC transporter ATP-binding protein [Verrucomicrobiae bacterium]
MNNLANVFRFGAPYIRRYWTRLALGVLLGVLFGISNATILSGSKALLNRVFPQEQNASATALPRTETTKRIEEWTNNARERFVRSTDPWLPKDGRDLDAKQLTGLLLFFPLLFAFRGYIGYLSSYCMGWVSERVINDLRQDVFHKLSTLSLDFYNRATMGDLITHVHGDTQALQKSLNHGVSDLVKEPVTIIFTLGYLLWMDWKLTVFVTVFMPTCIVPIMILGKKIRRAAKGNVKTGVLQQSLLVEFLGSIRLIKAYKLERQATERFAQHARQLVHHGMKQIQAKELVNPFIETIGALGLGILLVYIIWADKTGSELAVFVGAVALIYTPIKKVAGLHVYFQQASVGIERLMKIFREEPTVKEPTGPKAMKPFAREIRFDNVTFAYNDRPVLQNFSLTIPLGTKLGVVGESGSGKSTLINLLFRFYDPQEGRVLIDGVDIRELTTFDLRAQMALVSQDIILFDQTVAENIACGREGATRSEIEAAAKAAFAHEFIMNLPQGYDTRVGDRGVLLSGGQRQRIAIARAFIRQAPILALDEATAALDAESEAQVQRAIDNLAEHRTVISVAHRLSTLAKMDRIIVLQHGEIVEEGTFAELLRSEGIFGNMAQRQTFSTVLAS